MRQATNRLNLWLGGISNADRSTILLSTLVVGMLALFVIRVPTWVADALILVNFVFSVVMLAASLQVRRAAEFTVLPSVLLVTTFFRLGISLATTRLVLLDGDAGHVIETFGEFLLGGNVIVGLVVFLILTVVQFVVITKGAERVAEVSARFSLDALPGQQMSIEADLRSGLIDGLAAARQRATLVQESRFFGALDGAMKFVKGDAIAGIVIVFVNLLGGIVIGSLIHGMSLGESASRFMVLSIGDGMVAQIPSIVAALSCSFIITRVSDSDKGSIAIDIWRQILRRPIGLAMGALFAVAIATIPGMPVVSALVVALGFALLAAYARIARTGAESEEEAAARPSMQTIRLQVGDGLRRRGAQDGRLQLKIDEIPPQIERRYGVTTPRIQVNPAQRPMVLDMHYEDVELGRFEATDEDACVFVRWPVQNGAESLPPGAVAVCFGVLCLPAHHDSSHLTQLTLEELVCEFTLQTVRLRLANFFDLEATKNLLASAKASYPEHVGEIQRLLTNPKLCDVLRILLSDAIPVLHARVVLDAVIRYAPKERDPEPLGEYVRTSLSSFIFNEFKVQGTLHVALLEPGLEDFIRERTRKSILGNFVEVGGDDVQPFEDVLQRIQLHCVGGALSLLVQLDLRPALKALLLSRNILLPVLSMQEIPVSCHLKVGYVVKFEE